jgi:hypothetical protein
MDDLDKLHTLTTAPMATVGLSGMSGHELRRNFSTGRELQRRDHPRCEGEGSAQTKAAPPGGLRFVERGLTTNQQGGLISGSRMTGKTGADRRSSRHFFSVRLSRQGRRFLARAPASGAKAGEADVHRCPGGRFGRADCDHERVVNGRRVEHPWIGKSLREPEQHRSAAEVWISTYEGACCEIVLLEIRRLKTGCR